MDNYDFSGWATKNDLECMDGRTIRKDAFKDQDGTEVPLVWNHQHNDVENVLGHAILENRENGVYAYCSFNNTQKAQAAKEQVVHGDVKSLSIWANRLQEVGKDVTHGVIREVSLVLAGANPGAYVDYVIAHGEDEPEALEACYYEPIELFHSDDAKKEDEKKEAKKSESSNETDEKKTNSKTVKEIIETMNEEQKDALYAIVGNLVEDEEDDDDKNDKKEGEDEVKMKHNLFDNETMENENVLSHDAMKTIIADGKRYGSLRDSFLEHSAEYGIDQIEYLFPDAKNLNTPPEFIKRDTDWVQKVMSGTHHTPFSRIKSVFADITEEEARAKGYIKGKLKREEVFSLLKRTTTPTTIYKKQKMDRDDVVDITDFDVISWLKSEMRLMLDEEIARAILIGDGRLASSDDKINEQNVRPIYKDEELFTIRAKISLSSNATDDDKAKAFIKTIIKERKNYKGSGNPSLFATEDIITSCLLLEDTTGRTIYNSINELATKLRVKEIITVEVMEGVSREDSGKTYDLMGIMVNPNDYNVGADKGGAINMFDDFDIDYNQQKYLIETRISGALTKPYSAMVIESTTA
nr:MAG TPA: major capsid protein [Caudoviricetes sp.]